MSSLKRIQELVITLLGEQPEEYERIEARFREVYRELDNIDSKGFEPVMLADFLSFKGMLANQIDGTTISLDNVQKEVRTLLLRISESEERQRRLQPPSPTVKDGPMQIVITWSKTHSHDIAKYLKTWLPEIFPGIDPWVSSEDIQIGKPWFDELMGQFRRTAYSITCVTTENIRSPWVFYEVGIISGKQAGTSSTYLVGATVSDVKDTPLAQLQCAEATRDGTWKLVKSINKDLGDQAIAPAQLEASFNAVWGKLNSYLIRLVDRMGRNKEPVTTVFETALPALKPYSQRLLIAGLADGSILRVTNSGGSHITSGGKSLARNANPRETAKWDAALGELEKYVYANNTADGIWNLTEEGYNRAEILVAADPVLSLSKEAKELLLETSKSPGGNVQVAVSDGGGAVITNGKHYGATGGPRELALWKSALEEIVDRKFVESKQGTLLYTMTKSGFDAAAQLSGD